MKRILPCLCCLLGCSTFAGVVAAPVPSKVPPKFPGTELPVPPHQNDVWNHPNEPVAQVAEFLFKRGLADPRGCEYRSLQIATGNPWNGGGVPYFEHAWLIPGGSEGKQFAVAWNGLVYPVWQVGPPVSLAEDVKALLAAVKKAKAPLFEQSLEADAAKHGVVCPMKAVMLWRLGLVGSARELAQGRDETLLTLTQDWTWYRMDRAYCAHMRGDDRLALIDTEQLTALLPELQKEIAHRVPTPDHEDADTPSLSGFDELPQLLADSRRRVNRDATVPVTKGSDQAMVDALEFVDLRPGGDASEPDLISDGRVRAFIERHEELVDPLIETFDKDTRLTRIVWFPPGQPRDRYLVPVSEVAFAALEEILRKKFKTSQNNEALPHENVVGQIRTYWKSIKGVSTEERWYNVLRDDNAGPEAWEAAADSIVEMAAGADSDDEDIAKQARKAGLAGEVLRKGHSPSVGELLAKRSDEMAVASLDGTSLMAVSQTSVQLALDLEQWDSKAAQPVLVRRLKRLVSLTTSKEPGTGDYDDPRWLLDEIPELTRVLIKHGSPEVWPIFLGWVKHVEFGGDIDGKVLNTALLDPRPAAGGGVLEWLLNDPKSPFNLLISRQHYTYVDRDSLPKLTGTEMFLRQATRGLRDVHKIGTVKRTKEAESHGNFDVAMDGDSWTSGGWTWVEEVGPGLPKYNQALSFRVCDYYAWLLWTLRKAPRCELYWPESKRNLAVEQSRRWVTKHLKR